MVLEKASWCVDNFWDFLKLSLPCGPYLTDQLALSGSINITSIPACRKNRCAEKNDRYFDLKYLKICVHLNISYNFL
jgi:hypothetical protein